MAANVNRKREASRSDRIDRATLEHEVSLSSVDRIDKTGIGALMSLDGSHEANVASRSARIDRATLEHETSLSSSDRIDQTRIGARVRLEGSHEPSVASVAVGRICRSRVAHASNLRFDSTERTSG
jgi:hypothetical protein